MPVAGAFAPGPHGQSRSPLGYGPKDKCSGVEITPNFSFASLDGLHREKQESHRLWQRNAALVERHLGESVECEVGKMTDYRVAKPQLRSSQGAMRASPMGSKFTSRVIPGWRLAFPSINNT
jgi:hypothetical protein